MRTRSSWYQHALLNFARLRATSRSWMSCVVLHWNVAKETTILYRILVSRFLKSLSKYHWKWDMLYCSLSRWQWQVPKVCTTLEVICWSGNRWRVKMTCSHDYWRWWTRPSPLSLNMHTSHAPPCCPALLPVPRLWFAERPSLSSFWRASVRTSCAQLYSYGALAHTHCFCTVHPVMGCMPWNLRISTCARHNSCAARMAAQTLLLNGITIASSWRTWNLI